MCVVSNGPPRHCFEKKWWRGGRPTRELLLNLYLLKNLEKPNKKWLTMYIITILTGGGELVHVN